MGKGVCHWCLVHNVLIRRRLNDLAKESVLNDKIKASCQTFVRLPSIKSNVYNNKNELGNTVKANSFRNHYCNSLPFSSPKWQKWGNGPFLL